MNTFLCLGVDFPNAALPRCRTAAHSNGAILTFQNKSKIKSEKACFASENFVPLHCQIEEVDRRSLRVKIARFKSRNCAH